MEQVSTEINLERRSASVPVARAHVRQALQDWGYAAETIDDAALLVTELVDNAVRHTDGTRIAVHLTRHDDHVRCLVLDTDPTPPRTRTRTRGTSPARHEPSSATNPSDPEPVLPENGRGLRLVDAIASDWGSHPDTRTGWSRKAVWFTYATAEQPYVDTPTRPDRPPHEPTLPVRHQRPAPHRRAPPEDDPTILSRVLDGLRRLP